MAESNEFFREVDEEYRRDRIMQIWTRHSGLIIAALVLLIAAVGGWRYWQHVERTRAEAAGSRYEEAVSLAREKKTEEAEKALEAVAKEAPGGYRLLARFRLAAELGQKNPNEGAKAYDALAADAAVNGVWQDLARLRAAMLRFDTAEASAIRPALERLAAPTEPLAAHGPRNARPLGAQGGRLRVCRALVRPDRRRPRHAAGLALAA